MTASASTGGGTAAPKTLMDVFSGLLARAGAGPDDGGPALLDGLDLLRTGGDMIASLLQGQKPADGDPEASALTGLADLLLRIEAKVDAGGSIDPELLQKLKDGLDALAALLGGQANLTGGGMVEPMTTPGGTTIEPMIHPLAEKPEIEMTPPPSQDRALLSDLAAKLRALGEKMGAVDGVLSQKLTALAETVGTLTTSIDDLLTSSPELKAMIAGLLQSKPPASATASVTLASPELKLPENGSLSAQVEPANPEADLNADRIMLPPSDPATPNLKIEAKADPVIVTMGTEKREVAPQPANPPMPPAVASVDAAVGAHQTVNGDVRAIHTAYQSPSPINLPHMAFEIARQVQQGVSKFQIRLDPPELGRIDVKLDMDQSGQVNARLTVERSETLDLLQRDQRALERALAQAGLDAGKTNLEFSLKQNPFAGQDSGQQQAGASPFGEARPQAIVEAEAAAPVSIYRGTASASGVNIFV